MHLNITFPINAESITTQSIGNFDYVNGSNGYRGTGQKVGNFYYYNDNSHKNNNIKTSQYIGDQKYHSSNGRFLGTGLLSAKRSTSNRIGEDIGNLLKELAEHRNVQKENKQKIQFWESIGVDSNTAKALISQPESIQKTFLDRIENKKIITQQNIHKHQLKYNPQEIELLQSFNNPIDRKKVENLIEKQHQQVYLNNLSTRMSKNIPQFDNNVQTKNLNTMFQNLKYLLIKVMNALYKFIKIITQFFW